MSFSIPKFNPWLKFLIWKKNDNKKKANGQKYDENTNNVGGCGQRRGTGLPTAYGTSQRRLRRRFSSVRAGHQHTSPTLLQ